MANEYSTIQLALTILAVICGPGGLIIALLSRKWLAKKSDSESAKILEEAASGFAQTSRQWAEEVIEHYKKENLAIKQECQELKVEVETLTCRLDEDMEACKREIVELKEKVQVLETKNKRLLEALTKIIHQVRSRGDNPVVDAEEFQ